MLTGFPGTKLQRDGLSGFPASMTFEEIYEAYSPRVLNLVYRMTADEDTARDLTQDVFINVYRNLETFNRQSDLYTWIHRIAVNHVLNHIKKVRRARWIPFMDDDPSHARSTQSAFSAQQPADITLEQSERAAIVWKALRSLDPKYRIPLILHHYEQVPQKEIAELLGLTTAAVETRIHRAKQQLVRLLEPRLADM